MLTKPELRVFSHFVLRVGSSFIAVGGCLMEGGEKNMLKKPVNQMSDEEVLAEFGKIVDRAVKVRKENPLALGLGTRYPHMSNAENHRVIMPPLYFETASGKKIPQVVAMELPMQAFGLMGLLPGNPETFFSNLSELLYGPESYGYSSREDSPTREEYLNHKRDELCLRLKDILEGYKRGDVIFEELMIDVANENSLSELLEAAQNADWRTSVSRDRFLDCMVAFHTALEEAFRERGQIDLFYFERPPQYSRRELYINRLRQLLKQIQEN